MAEQNESYVTSSAFNNAQNMFLQADFKINQFNAENQGKAIFKHNKFSSMTIEQMNTFRNLHVPEKPTTTPVQSPPGSHAELQQLIQVRKNREDIKLARMNGVTSILAQVAQNDEPEFVEQDCPEGEFWHFYNEMCMPCQSGCLECKSTKNCT
jgi:hypothetical protein